MSAAGAVARGQFRAASRLEGQSLELSELGDLGPPIGMWEDG